MDFSLPDATTRVLADGPAVASAAVQLIGAAADAAIKTRGIFHIALAGGTTPKLAYQLLAQTEQDWSRWQIWFGDERCLPSDHAERNSVMAAANWLDPIALPAANRHPIQAERGAEAAARAYQQAIASALPLDLVLLGMGEDGHTASLFPGQAHPADQSVNAVHNAPKPPPDRVSLSNATLSAAGQVVMLITGAGKHPALQRWQQGEALPINQIKPSDGPVVLLDSAAVTG